MENLLMAYANQLSMYIDKGEEVYRQILSLQEENADYIVCPEHIGDSIWIAAFVADYKLTHDCEKVFLVGKDSQVEIIGRFPGVDGTVAITSEEMLNLRRFIIYTNKYNDNHIIYAHFRARFYLEESGINVENVSDERIYGTMESTRKAMLGIPEEYKASPRNMLTFDDGNNTELKEMFSRAVLFCPTMQTQRGYIPDKVFLKLINKYVESGYICYTNYNSFEYERMIPNTIPLASSLKEFSVIAPYFKQVIAVRSGACDLLAQTDTNLSVIYHKLDAPGTTRVCALQEEVGQLSVFTLRNRERMREYVYDDETEDELVNAVFAQLEE